MDVEGGTFWKYVKFFGMKFEDIGIRGNEENSESNLSVPLVLYI